VRCVLALWLTAQTAVLALAAGPLSVSELNYNDVEDNDLEFIELINTGTAPLTLTGATFTNAITYTFTAATVLNAGERIVIVRDRAKFLARYGTTGIRLANGVFGGRFSDNGELVSLVDRFGARLLHFTYSTRGRWPSRPNGLGSTLECIDPTGDLDDAHNWRASSEWRGSPGRAGAGPQRVVVINEILAHTDPPFEDAIELLNLTDQPVHIGGWYLSNRRSNPRKFRIPNGTLIAPRGFLVFYEMALRTGVAGFNTSGTGDAPDFTLSAAYEDETVLMSADAAGNFQFWMDALRFAPTVNGLSLGRHPDGTGPLTTLVRQTFGTDVTSSMPATMLPVFRAGAGASNAAPLVGPIVFTKIQYHPVDGGDEYLELQNNTAAAVPLFDPLFPTNTWRLRGAVDFDFPQGITVQAGARLMVVPIDPNVFRQKYEIPAGIPIFGPWTNSLNNAGERVTLFRPDAPQGPLRPDAGYVPYVVAEEVEYKPTAPWPVAADGTGAALVRKNPLQFGNDPDAWEAESIAPREPPVLRISERANGIRLTFEAEAGRTYRLEQQSVFGSAWTDLGVIPTDTNPVVVDLGPTPGYSRVRVE
jgi:hypothetical protein